MRASVRSVAHNTEANAPPPVDNSLDRQSLMALNSGANTLRMSVKPGLLRSSTLRRGSIFGASNGAPERGGSILHHGGSQGEPAPSQPVTAAVVNLRTGLERLMLRLDGAIRRFQVVVMLPGARVFSCERTMQTGTFEVHSGPPPARPVFSSAHDFEVVDFLMRELTPCNAEDPCVVSCMSWARGLPAQGQHDIFCLPLLTGETENGVQLSSALIRPPGRGACGSLVYITSDASELEGVRRVAVAFNPQTLFDLCANLAEKWGSPDGSTGVAFMLPCSPSTGRRFQPWKDVRWLPSEREGVVSSFARRLFGSH